MHGHDFDLFVLGAGSGGVRAARMAARYGARVAIVEERHFGGTCVHRGCIPKKLLVYGAHVAEELEDARGYGWSFDGVRFDWPTLVRNKDAELARLDGVYRRILDQAGVTILEGRGVFEGPNTIRVGERCVTAEHILIATGSRPSRPDVPGAGLGITSDDAFGLESLPSRVLITGAGYVALEFACIFRALGVETHVVHRGERILRGFDADLAKSVEANLRAKGIELHLGRQVARITAEGAETSVHLEGGDVLSGDLLLHGIGRRPNVAGLGLEAAGVRLDARGAIAVDGHYRTSAPHIFAVGDVIDRMPLTPVALAEGMAVANTLYAGEGPATVDYDLVPTAVFTMPQAATVGLTEDEARRRGHELRIFRSEFRPLVHTLSGRKERTMVKLVVDAETSRVLGCHLVAADAAEIIQGFATALVCGATKAQFDATLAVHPSVAEELVTMREPSS
jgi:glutathione reductase (NADPH)